MYFVRAHRRLSNPSYAQIQLAKLDYIFLSEDYTYVKGHYKGDKNIHTIYQSKSVINLINTNSQKKVSDNNVTDWFIFEEQVNKLYHKFGYEIIYRSPLYGGYGGVDMRARKN